MSDTLSNGVLFGARGCYKMEEARLYGSYELMTVMIPRKD